MVTAIHAETIKSYQMEHVFVQLDTQSTHVEFALFHAHQANSSSKELALLALSIPSSILQLMAALVHQDTI
jgi:hypothetical protein